MTDPTSLPADHDAIIRADIEDRVDDVDTALVISYPAGRPGVVDVTDRLTPGARAIVRERTEQMLNTPHPPLVAARMNDAVADALDVQPDPWLDGFWGMVGDAARAAREAEDERLRNAFNAGRAYARGEAIARRVGKSRAALEQMARDAAAEYLVDHDDPQATVLASAVLAGFTGTDIAQVS